MCCLTKQVLSSGEKTGKSRDLTVEQSADKFLGYICISAIHTWMSSKTSFKVSPHVQRLFFSPSLCKPSWLNAQHIHRNRCVLTIWRVPTQHWYKPSLQWDLFALLRDPECPKCPWIPLCLCLSLSALNPWFLIHQCLWIPHHPNPDLSGPVTFFAVSSPGALQATEDIPSPSPLFLLLVMEPAPCS